MKQLHHQEKEQFKTLFHQENIDRLEDRYEVLEAFLNTEHHVTAGDLFDTLAGQGSHLTLEFIQETLRLLCHFGFALKNRFENGHVRYEHRHIGHHHDHLVCTKCLSIVEFENQELENLQTQIAARHGFHPLQHKTELYGICPNCQKDRSGLTPLILAKAGERLVIREVGGGSGARMRLMTMGLRVGDVLEVITNISKGQIAVAVDCRRYVIGRGLAQKIFVTPAEKTGDHHECRES